MKSMLEGKVGEFFLKWKHSPRGQSGTGVVQIGSEEISVSWRRDQQGLWIECPWGVFGFDFSAKIEEQEDIQLSVSRRNSAEKWENQQFLRLQTSRDESSSKQRKKSSRVRAQMPGKIVRVLVQAGESILKDQPLIVMEAMKMENEIRSPCSGVVEQIKVSEGQAVESGADLLILV